LFGPKAVAKQGYSSEMSQQSAPQTLATSSDSPPIARLLPFISTTFSFITSSIFSVLPTAYGVLSLVSSLLLAPILAFASLLDLSPLVWIFLYTIAPFVSVLQIALDVFVRTPYAAAAYVFDVLSPIYVFCGVAIIIGSLIGFGGRIISLALVNWAVPIKRSQLL
jgi:hypothetical protein